MKFTDLTVAEQDERIAVLQEEARIASKNLLDAVVARGVTHRIFTVIAVDCDEDGNVLYGHALHYTSDLEIGPETGVEILSGVLEQLEQTLPPLPKIEMH